MSALKALQNRRGTNKSINEDSSVTMVLTGGGGWGSNRKPEKRDPNLR